MPQLLYKVSPRAQSESEKGRSLRKKGRSLYYIDYEHDKYILSKIRGIKDPFQLVQKRFSKG